jgi:predicted RNase H-like HicB family nuclease
MPTMAGRNSWVVEIKMPAFIAIVFQDPDGGCAVTFPDLPGCVAFTDQFDNAGCDGAAVLAKHLQAMLAAGEAFPTCSGENDFVDDPDYVGGQIMAIAVPLSRSLDRP